MNQIRLIDYTIDFGEAPDVISAFIDGKDYSSVNILVDENTKKHCLPKIANIAIDPLIIEIESGETNKTLTTCEHIWSHLQNNSVDRHALMINLGGGVIGDMGGFAASTYMRGVDFIQIPTTLLSQVDASVGGKLGVDFKGYKNFIGLFKNPGKVVIDTAFLNTLPGEELRSGYAEMIKHALIKDKSIWTNYLSRNDWRNNIDNEYIYESVRIKKEVVLKDPFEKGLRKILNFGHTLGHAIETESFSTNRPLLHGHAIALGIVGEAFLSKRLCGLPDKALRAIVDYILSIYPMRNDLADNLDQIVDHVKKDKKNRNKKSLFSLLSRIGQCEINIEVQDNHIKESLEYLFSLD